MALNTLKYNHLTLLGLKGLNCLAFRAIIMMDDTKLVVILDGQLIKFGTAKAELYKHSGSFSMHYM